MARQSLRIGTILYVSLLVGAPLVMLLVQTASLGSRTIQQTLQTPTLMHALYLTILITLIAVIFNTAFGVLFSLLLTRFRMPLIRWLNPLVNLPLTLSPIVVGLALYLLYGINGWFGPWLLRHNIHILFAVPAMVLATMFVTLPFVARELIPVLEEIGEDQEEAAASLGASPGTILWRITLPSLTPALISGIAMATAFSLGEYGAISMVSGDILGVTETLTLHIQLAFDTLNQPAADISAVILIILAVIMLLALKTLSGVTAQTAINQEPALEEDAYGHRGA